MNAESYTAPVARSTTQPMYWSVLREVWENKSIYMAPSIVSAVILLGALISAGHLPERRRSAMLLDDARRQAAIQLPYDIVAMIIILTAFIVGFFYCLDALYGERRDRSILFWKSLPVSDLTTVLSKATIPLVVLPLIIFAIIVTTQFVMLLMSSVVLLTSGLAGTTWIRFNLFQQSLILLYSLIALTLWTAPIYGWLLLVSSWARRATFLWAVLPFFAISVLEKIAFNSSYFASMLRYRFMDFASEAFVFDPHSKVVASVTQLTPGRFLSTPGLWTGLAFAALCIAAAVRLRRNRDPI